MATLVREALARAALLVLVALAAPAAVARCIAVDGDSLVCDNRKIRLSNVYAAELKEPGGRHHQAMTHQNQKLMLHRLILPQMRCHRSFRISSNFSRI